MKKVLIFYATYGGGHLSAAKSIKQYIDENYSDVQTEMIDCVKYINNAIDKITTDAYKEMAKKAPWAWEKVYYSSEDGFLSKVSTTANKIMAVKMAKLFREYKPDVVISTHPFGSQMTSYLKQKGKTNCILTTILTDFESHDQWVIGSKFVNYFFVSNVNMKQEMTKKNNIPQEKIFVTGIPISKKFLEKYNKAVILKEYNFTPNKKTILFFGGGEYGLGKNKTISILKTLCEFRNIQVIAIAGKNEKLKSEFEKVVNEKNMEQNIVVLSFTDKVPQLMASSDLVVTKPGGLTISESLASGLPLILINPIPGQEEANARFLENAGCAIWLKDEKKANEIFSNILLNDKRLETMKENSMRIAKPHSTENICKTVLND